MERLNKVLAAAGIDSRRNCDDLIRAGRVTVDGKCVRDLGTRVGPDQEISVDGFPIKNQRLVYWLVNKPKGYLCTNRDPGRRPKVIDLIPHVRERVYTVGRLDENSEGLVLLTNDGPLAQKLTHPRFEVEKTYIVQTAGRTSRESLQKMTSGIWISDGRVRATRVRRIGSRGDSTFLRIVLSEGKNREIRRMMAKLGHKVLHLQRVAIGPIQLGRLRRGRSRQLKKPEIEHLRRFVSAAGGDERSNKFLSCGRVS